MTKALEPDKSIITASGTDTVADTAPTGTSTRRRRVGRVVGTAAFIGIALWLLLQVAYLVRPAMFGNYRFIWTGFYTEEKNTMDVITVGSSEIYRFIDTPYLYENFGITSYNLSSGSMLAETFKYVIEESESYQTPKLYIVGVRMFLFESTQVVSRTSSIRRLTDNMNFFSPVRWRIIFDMVEDPAERLEYAFDLLTYHGNYDQLTWRNRQYMGNRYNSTMKGWRNTFVANDMSAEENFIGETQAVPLDATDEQHLLDFLEYCTERELPVLFVSTPWLCTEEEAGMSETVRRIIESYGYPMLDMNTVEAKESMDLDVTADFYNRKHTNTWGAEKVTQYLGEYLEEHYDLTSERTDSVLASWSSAVNVYHRELGEAIEREQSAEGKTESESESESELS